MTISLQLLVSQSFIFLSFLIVAILQPQQSILRVHADTATRNAHLHFLGSKVQKSRTSSKLLWENVLEIFWLQFSVHGASLYIQIDLAPCTDSPKGVIDMAGSIFSPTYWATRQQITHNVKNAKWQYNANIGNLIFFLKSYLLGTLQHYF